jgi:hypothetical protein
MHFYQNHQISEIRQRELQQEAENIRLAQTADAHGAPIYGPALARVGGVLISVGQQLQERYSDYRDALDQPAMLSDAGAEAAR